MSRRAKFDSHIAIADRIKEGRGAGTGASYRPWLEVKDVPSKGRRHRYLCQLNNRTVHLMSDLERSAIFVAEYLSNWVVDIREQYPLLPLEETEEIAQQLRVRHPKFYRPNACNVVMTTDLLLTVLRPEGEQLVAWSVKYSVDQAKRRTEQKTAIEAEYWRRRNVSLSYFDEQSVSTNFLRNWAHIRVTLRKGYFDYFTDSLVDKVNESLGAIAKAGELTLDELTSRGAKQLGIARGEILTAIHFLIASRIWPVDLDQPLRPYLSLVFLKPEEQT